MLSLELQADDHGLVECTCGHIGFVDEADPNTGDCVNCADEKARASMAEARAEARAEGGGLGITEVLKDGSTELPVSYEQKTGSGLL
jgi:hypothetical protein